MYTSKMDNRRFLERLPYLSPIVQNVCLPWKQLAQENVPWVHIYDQIRKHALGLKDQLRANLYKHQRHTAELVYKELLGLIEDEPRYGEQVMVLLHGETEWRKGVCIKPRKHAVQLDDVLDYADEYTIAEWKPIPGSDLIALDPQDD